MSLRVALPLALSFAVALCQNTNITALFAPSLSPNAEIFLPSIATYAEDVTQRWTLYKAPSYMGAIKPATEADIQNIVKIASTHRIPFLATGGGYGSSITYGALHNGLDIDLSNFDSVSLDAGNNLLTIGGATQFQQLYEPLYASGKEFPIASVPCTGVVGTTLGGGVGPFQGLHGLMIDALQSVRLVVACGDVVTASRTENADLFWGIRGAGFNFGIVTSATYRVYDAPNDGQITTVDFFFPASANRSIWEILKSFDNTLPPSLVLTTIVGYNHAARQPFIEERALFYGPAEEGMKYLAPFIDLKPVKTQTATLPWSQLLSIIYSNTTICSVGQYLNAYSVGIKQTDVATFEAFFNELAAFHRQYPDYRGVFDVQRYPNQAVVAVPDSETAYPHREIKTQLIFQNSYPRNSTLDGPVNDFMRATRARFQQTSGFQDLSVYVNYAHGDEGPAVWYSRRKLAKLIRLKRRWDPAQLFSWNNPVPLR